MPQKVLEAVREHIPGILAGEAQKQLSGIELMRVADGMQLVPRAEGAPLTPDQKRAQRIIGSCKFIEKVMPMLSLPLHRLSCVMSSPPPEANAVAKAVLSAAWTQRDVGLVYGGVASAGLQGSLVGGVQSDAFGLDHPAPDGLCMAADACWGDRCMYGLCLTYRGAAVHHVTKKLGLIVDSTMEAEAMASSRGGEIIDMAREIEHVLGHPPAGPTPLLTDNRANKLVASGEGNAQRSKHFLRRYYTLKQRVARREVAMVFVGDADMPADFLTKFVGKEKIKRSVEYATNASAWMA